MQPCACSSAAETIHVTGRSAHAVSLLLPAHDAARGTCAIYVQQDACKSTADDIDGVAFITPTASLCKALTILQS